MEYVIADLVFGHVLVCSEDAFECDIGSLFDGVEG
jgi:hypothetical protein